MIRTLVLALAVAACPATAGAQSFFSIFTQLPADFGHLAEPSNLIILGGAGAGALATHPKDEAIALRTNDNEQIFVAGDVLGNGVVQAAAGLAVWAGGRMKHNQRIGTLGIDLVQAQIVSGLITDSLKLATDRTRPDGDQYSFPSGHTSTAFAAAAVLQSHFGWKVGVPSYLMAAYVGSSRVAAYRHYASDVIFGAGIGLAAGRATTFQVWGKRVNVSPSVSKSGSSVNVTVQTP
jgi:membrane-associated phospholipid phosphatase